MEPADILFSKCCIQQVLYSASAVFSKCSQLALPLVRKRRLSPQAGEWEEAVDDFESARACSHSFSASASRLAPARAAS